MRRLIGEETGAVALIVAVSLVVLVGMAAFVVDIGDAYWERRMLQNSADSAALAVAMDCALGDCGSDAEYRQVAEQYAAENNVRGAVVDSVTGPDGTPLTFESGEVRVITSTDAEGGRLRQWFSGVLGQEQGLRTTATAVAEWGAADLSRGASPLSISICAWGRMTGFDVESGLPTAGDVQLPTVEEAAQLVAGGNLGETIIYLDPFEAGQGPGGGPPGGGPPGGGPPGGGPGGERPAEDQDCHAPPGFYNDLASGEKIPASFGWLRSNVCQVTVRVDESGNQWARAKPGVSAGGETACVQNLRNTTPPVAVFPIFTGARQGGGGATAELQIITPAAFYITGYRLPGAGGAVTWSVPGGSVPCSAPQTCIRGHFVQKLEAGSRPTSAAPFGLSSVALKE